ncbi:DegV family protein [Arenimonas daejeonensis]|uniref:DegV family protein n=1 Tax=Arenimonas daejeonensis TaxID=370777 RepID=UPI00223F8E8B|nr:DegV family protein [Arenimonas daejeonensis]
MGEGLDRAGLRAAIGELGASCVVIAGSHTRLRLHAHVADPRAMFETAARFGRVEGSKADDMHAQARTAAGTVGVAVITDSAADLPEDVQQRLNIHMVPARVNFGDQDYLDKVGLSTAEFYRKLRTELVLPRTSQPPPGDFRRQFEFLLSHHRELVYVGLSRTVSGTLQSAETAAQRGHAERTHVFDTGNASCGEGLLAIRAGEMALAGAGAPQILAELARLKPLTLTWAAARDISHAVRGGRIPAWAKPLVEFGLHAGGAGEGRWAPGRGRWPGRQVARAGAPGGLCRQAGGHAHPLAADGRPLRCAGRWRNAAGGPAPAPGCERELAGRNRTGHRRACRPRHPGGVAAARGLTIAWGWPIMRP